MKRAIVLSGGGSKGSYQIGVWKALRKLKIDYQIVTGTSVGALNGSLMTQKTYFRAKYIWHKLNLDYLFDQSPKSNQNLDVLKLFGRNFVQQGGMPLQKIERIIEQYISPAKFYRSSIDFGLISFNATTKKEVVLTKKEIPQTKLVDYLMASATCFPAFQMKKIDGQSYIDGGIYDNLPINLAITMGADELIVVNLKAPGITRKPKQTKPTIVITPRNQISFFLNFNPEQAKTNIQYGYNDTMKVFHKLDGNIFTFRKGTITKWYHKEQKYLQKKLHKKITTTHFLHLIESLGKSFHLAEYKIYRPYTFKKALCTKVREQEKVSSEIKKQLKSLSWKKGSNTKVITLYMLSKLEKNQRIDKRLQTLFQKNYEQAILLQQMGCYYGK